MVRIQFSIGLQYEVGFPGADFIFNIQASRTRQQTVIAEQLTLSQSLPTLAHTDAITHARSLRVSALPGPFNVHYQATVDLNHHVANPAQVPEVPVASLPPEVRDGVLGIRLGLIGPIIAAFTFTDDLAVLGTNVEEISQLLNAEELNHKETPIKLEDTGISLRSVSFSYDGTTEVLHDVNLAIHPGTMTALVGPSGSGKSTVAKLIAGYWDVTSGSITLGGHELKDIPLSEIADQISYVSQDNYLFNRSIRENIRMGRPSATDAEVEQAAKQSGCDAFIRKLDNGYDTVVGSAGSHLSGGERQRIAIARAMLKNAPVVILDEATAYIDPENEALVQKAISTLTVGKTLIVIAHRLSTIVGADNIVVVKDGTIHAQGTHEKLLETCPLYRDMWQAHIGAKDQM